MKLEKEKESGGNIPEQCPGHLISYEVKGQLMKPTTSLPNVLEGESFTVYSDETPDDQTADNFGNSAAAFRGQSRTLIEFFI